MRTCAARQRVSGCYSRLSKTSSCDFATDGCKKWKECDEFHLRTFKGGLNNDVKNLNDLYARGLRLPWSDFRSMATSSRIT